MVKKYVLLIMVILLIGSCQTQKNDNSIHGTWESIGYGKILKIEDDDYKLYDVTKISCLPIEQGQLSKFGRNISVKNDTLSVSIGIGKYLYKRLHSFPKLCSMKLSDEKRNDPIYNFEVFSQTIKSHFAYFQENKINWDSLYAETRFKINSKTSDMELYLALENIINALNDNHGYIEPSDDVYKQMEKPIAQSEKVEDTENTRKYGDFEIAQLVFDHYVEEDFTNDSWLMKWGKMKNNVGYVQVKSMWLYADLNLSDSLVQQNGFVNTYVEAFNKLSEEEYIEKERKGVASILDMAINDLKETKHLIVDVRFNGGGQDVVGLEILKRFNDNKIKIATKKAVNNLSYTNEIPIYLEAATNPYTKPVFLLTSRQTASAADFFALGSLRLDNVKRIGSNTNGALSDALEKQLPNGWYFSVSNEVYEDTNGKCYENKGIPVDVELNYSDNRQTFFGNIANNLEKEKENTLRAIDGFYVDQR